MIATNLEDETVRQQYESLRAQLEKQLDGNLRGCVIFYGPTDHDASSELLGHLGTYLAESGTTSVLLVDADSRDRLLSQHFQVHGERGLSDAALGDIATNQAFLKTSFPNLSVSSTGSADKFAGLTPQDVRYFIEESRHVFDLVLIAAGGPQSSSPQLLSHLGDANLLTVFLGENDREQVRDDWQRLHDAGIQMHATVVVNARPNEPLTTGSG